MSIAAREQRQEAPNQPCPPDVGSSPSPRLARALADARKSSVPKSRIDAALALAARSGGSKTDATYSDALTGGPTRTYEAEYPGGVGVLVRLAAEDSCEDSERSSVHGSAQAVRGLFQKTGGKGGSCRWLFEDIWTVECRCRTGANPVDLEAVVAAGIEGGAEDVEEMREADMTNLEGSGADDSENVPIIVFTVAGRKEAASVKAAVAGLSEVLYDGGSVWVERETRAKQLVATEEKGWEQLGALCRRLRQRDDFVEVTHNASPPHSPDS